jgi:hypothetical protein
MSSKGHVASSMPTAALLLVSPMLLATNYLLLKPEASS